MATKLRFELAGSQIDGARDYQEDAFLITQLEDEHGAPSALVVVADGMGGHAAGNVASNMAIQVFNTNISTQYPSDHVNEILHASVMKANSSIAETIGETPALQGMGCTMVAAVVEGRGLWWASVGDSHLYMLRSRKLTKRNADHSYGAYLDRMEAAGKEVEPDPNLRRNMLMSAVTGEEIAEVDCPDEPIGLAPGDRILLCSDGMDTLSQGMLLQISQLSKGPKECADALLEAVTEANKPRQDNTTVVVIDVAEYTAVKGAAPKRLKGKDKLAARKELAKELGLKVEEPKQQKKARAANTGQRILYAMAALVVISLATFAVLLNPQWLGNTGLQPSAPVDVPLPTDAAQPTDAADGTTAPQDQVADVDEQPSVVPDAVAPTLELETLRDPLNGGGEGPLMVILPAGEFRMGAPGSAGVVAEFPIRKVTLRYQFAVSKYEITNAEYRRFAQDTGRALPQGSQAGSYDDFPVVNVTWEDAFFYTRWLTERTGRRYRLPSEAEWEYAAAAGSSKHFWWGSEMEEGRAHCRLGCGSPLDINSTAKVGSFPANAFGLHDTAGNVSEWVEDCWHANYSGAPTDGGVWLGGDCARRVIRGGAYDSPELSMRTAFRSNNPVGRKRASLGFRVARALR